jgi:AraC-like DNA-binding protein
MPTLPLLHLKPPYTEESTSLLVRGVDPDRVVPGSILALHVTCSSVDWGLCSEVVGRIRTRVPSLPIVLHLSGEVENGLYLASQAGRASIRAVLSGGFPLRDSLRRQLTAPANLGNDVAEWLPLCGVRLTPILRHLVAEIFSRAPEHLELGPLLHSIGAAESSTRFRFRKKGLPAPSRWLQAARALHAALRIQGDPERSILAHACELGYADHSALCHQMKRVFGVTPAAVRDTLGWEWLLARWIAAEVVRSPGSPPTPL